MNALQAALSALATDLAALHARFALVGGLAVGIRTEPRFTRDADVVIAVDDDRSAERLVRDLLLRGYRPVTVLEQEAENRLSTVRLSLPAEGPSGIVLDLLFASSGIESEIVGSADVLEVLPGLRMPVASTGHLIALKVLSRDDDLRPQDAVDLKALARIASDQDRIVAREALALISQRGFNRGRDLAAGAREVLGR